MRELIPYVLLKILVNKDTTHTLVAKISSGVYAYYFSNRVRMINSKSG